MTREEKDEILSIKCPPESELEKLTRENQRMREAIKRHHDNWEDAGGNCMAECAMVCEALKEGNS